MRVVEIKNLQREEGQIFYLRKYTGDVVVELPTSTESISLNFSIETSPIGKKIIELDFENTLNYPLLPLKKSIIEYILTEEIEGRLPC